MSARDAELLEDEVRTLQARLGELEEDLRRTKLDAYQVALERDTLQAWADGLGDAAWAERLRVLFYEHTHGLDDGALYVDAVGRAELYAIIAAAEQRAAAKPAESVAERVLLQEQRDKSQSLRAIVLGAAKPAEGGETGEPT
jgi:hypothetical protein